MNDIAMKNESSKEHLSRLATAYHEAGHAVVDLYHGFEVRAVTTCGDAESYGRVSGPGLLLYDGSARQRRAWARQMILGLYAGVEAQRLVDPSPADHHGSEDDNDAFELSRQYGVFPRHMSYVGDDLHLAYLDRLRAEARRLVIRLRAPVGALAGVLLERETLTAEEARVTVEPWIPTAESFNR